MRTVLSLMVISLLITTSALGADDDKKGKGKGKKPDPAKVKKVDPGKEPATKDDIKLVLQAIDGLGKKMDNGFKAVNDRQDPFDKRLGRVEGKVDQVLGKQAEHDARFDKTDGRLANLEKQNEEMRCLLKDKQALAQHVTVVNVLPAPPPKVVHHHHHGNGSLGPIYRMNGTYYMAASNRGGYWYWCPYRGWVWYSSYQYEYQYQYEYPVFGIPY